MIISGNKAIEILSEAFGITQKHITKMVITLEMNEVAVIEVTSMMDEKGFKEIVKEFAFIERQKPKAKL